MCVSLPNSRRHPIPHQNMSDGITLGEPVRRQSQGCGCLRRDGRRGSRPVKRGSDLKYSKRSKLTQTSPQTSCLRASLRQGNPAGAKGPVRVDMCVCVCVLLNVLVFGAWPGRSGGIGGVMRVVGPFGKNTERAT